MDTIELSDEISLILATLRLDVGEVVVDSHLPIFHVIEDFGMVVVGINSADYTQVLSKLTSEYMGYRYFYIEVGDNLLEKKQSLIWDLMRSGYMRYLRNNFPRQFKSILNGGLSRQIITERLRVWNNKPKYKYWISDNENALNATITYILAMDASFFDYMPEEEGGDTNA